MLSEESGQWQTGLAARYTSGSYPAHPPRRWRSNNANERRDSLPGGRGRWTSAAAYSRKAATQSTRRWLPPLPKGSPEPLVSSIGGNGSLQVLHAASGQHLSIDFYGRAPLAATPEMWGRQGRAATPSRPVAARGVHQPDGPPRRHRAGNADGPPRGGRPGLGRSPGPSWWRPPSSSLRTGSRFRASRRTSG